MERVITFQNACIDSAFQSYFQMQFHTEGHCRPNEIIRQVPYILAVNHDKFLLLGG